MKNLVNQDWLKKKIVEDSVVIFDVRYKLGDEVYGGEEYKKGHIPGAIFIAMEELLTGDVEEHGGRHPLPDMETFRRAINELGVDDDIDVVIYDDGEIAMAGRLWFMLRYLGKKNVYILDGGMKEWALFGNKIDREENHPKMRGTLKTNYNKAIVADVNDVKKAIYNNKVAIIDSRTSDRYRGEIEPIDRVPGHIPTSLNYPWPELVEREEKWTKELLLDHYKDLVKFDEILVHCGSGITGTVNMIFLEEAGLNARLYNGGYSDWISYPENEIKKEV
ncbi:MAG: sulfurtransferase [Gudongella sp.]|nr:sulfurtransferase [Gudongella sp.]